MQDSSTLIQFNKKYPCYFCGKPGPSTKEHAPVKTLFRGINCDRITVPSCDEHNSVKHLTDRAVITFFVKGFLTDLVDKPATANQLKVLRAYDQNKATEVSLRTWVEDPFGQFDSPLAHINKTPLIENWIRQLTAALTWSVIGTRDPNIDWGKIPVWSPEYFFDQGKISIQSAAQQILAKRVTREKINDLIKYWWKGWSSYPNQYPPDIYRFEVGFFQIDLGSRDFENDLLIRHWFFGKFSWYALVSPSAPTKANVLNVLMRINA